MSLKISGVLIYRIFHKLFLQVVVFTLFLSACSNQPSIPSIDEMVIKKGENSRYTVGDSYVDHRAQQQTITTLNGQIAYLDYGQGPVIVMLHGVPTSSWMFRKMIEPLQSDYRIVAIDLLGFGSSDKPESNDTNYHPNSQAQYVEQVLSHLQIDDYSLLFHDMGGLVAWELLDRDISNTTGNNIENLLVLNTIIDKQGFDYPKLEKGVTARLMSDAFVNDLSSAAVLDMTFDNMGLSTNATLTEGECFGYVAPMREGNGDVLYEFYTSFDEARFTMLQQQVSNLSQFDGGILVMWGGQDSVLTTEQISVLQEAADLEQENIHVFADNSHFLPEEIPQILNQRIRQFIKTN